MERPGGPGEAFGGIRAAIARRAKSGAAPKKKTPAVSTVAATTLTIETAEQVTA